MEQRHIPVLVDEVISLLGCAPHRNYVDATLGGGGHSLEILKRTGPDGKLIGIEWDQEAIAEAKKTLSRFGERVKIFRENFVHLDDLLKEMNMEPVDGVLFDLGLSSIQLEREERGFSFRGEGPLDMRMDQRAEATAADFINRLSLKELEEMFLKYGEERWGRRIAKAIDKERERNPIETTQHLRKVIYRAIPRRLQWRRIDPATRAFQALRIEVNQELSNLRQALENGWPLLKPGGRLCVISFHSLEDRIVKETFRKLQKEEGVIHVLTPKPITPSENEQKENPRSRSAKLRCAERR